MNVHRSRRSALGAHLSLPVSEEIDATMTTVYIVVRNALDVLTLFSNWVQTGPAPVAGVCADGIDDDGDESTTH